MASYRFIKDNLGWYADLKNTPFTRDNLAMICGADTLLDLISGERKEVMLNAGTSYIKGYEQLHRKKIFNFGLDGAYYIIHSYKGNEINHNLWLCPVMLWVFLRYPKIIYFSEREQL